MELQGAEMATPLGPLAVVARERGVCVIEFATLAEVATRLGERVVDAVDPLGAVSALAAYLRGDLTALEGVPVAVQGTAFQAQVWAELRKIPAGQTWSYGQLAERLNCGNAVRAVGAANGRNPVAIVVPCHRVIAGSGKLQGYAGGLERKAWLLRHERAILA